MGPTQVIAANPTAVRENASGLNSNNQELHGMSSFIHWNCNEINRFIRLNDLNKIRDNKLFDRLNIKI